jgi:hypothetical protein
MVSTPKYRRLIIYADKIVTTRFTGKILPINL